MYLQNMQNGDGYHTGRKLKFLHAFLLSHSRISWVIDPQHQEKCQQVLLTSGACLHEGWVVQYIRQLIKQRKNNLATLISG